MPLQCQQMRQRTLAMMNGFERYSKKTRRALFLEEMEQVVPWGKLCGLIEAYYPKAGNGRPAVGVERMLRIYFLQQWFNLSDPAVEEALYDCTPDGHCRGQQHGGKSSQVSHAVFQTHLSRAVIALRFRPHQLRR